MILSLTEYVKIVDVRKVFYIWAFLSLGGGGRGGGVKIRFNFDDVYIQHIDCYSIKGGYKKHIDARIKDGRIIKYTLKTVLNL